MKVYRFRKVILLILCLAVLAPLLVYAYTGTFSRYWADDYCHSGDIVKEGFWRAQVVVYMNSSDRFAVEPVIGLSELFGPVAVRVLPGLVLLVWLVGMVFMIRQLSLVLHLPAGRFGVIAFAAAILFFVLLTAPSRFQSLYWRAGLITYLLPLVFLTWLAGLVLSRLKVSSEGELSGWFVVLIGLVAFYGGGFSETSAALQTGAVGLALAGSWLWVKGRRRKRALSLLLAALTGSLLSMLVLFVSPAAHLRQSNFAPPPDLVRLVTLSARYGFDFVVDAFKVVPLPLLVCLVFAALSSYLVYWRRDYARRDEGKLTAVPAWRQVVLRSLAGFGFAYLLSVCCCAPSVYAYQAYPEPRALITNQFVVVLLASWLGWQAGAGLYRLVFSRYYRMVSFFGGAVLLLLLVVGAYPLRAAVQAYRQVPEYRRRAAQWDERDAFIRQAVSDGEREIEVVVFDSIGAIGDISTDPDLWVNECAAHYYELDAITGLLP